MGIDIGSRTIKIVIMNPNTMQIKDFYITDTTATPKAQAEKAIEKILSQNNIEKDEIVYTVATGYSREQFPNSNKTVTEITCQACGINYANIDTFTSDNIHPNKEGHKLLCNKIKAELISKY